MPQEKGLKAIRKWPISAETTYECFFFSPSLSHCLPFTKVRANAVMLERKSHRPTKLQFITSDSGTDVTEERSIFGVIADK